MIKTFTTSLLNKTVRFCIFFFSEGSQSSQYFVRHTCVNKEEEQHDDDSGENQNYLNKTTSSKSHFDAPNPKNKKLA